MSEPADPTAPAPTAPSEEEAWSLVQASWADEAAHRAYLARFTDLEGLAMAGGRYRAVLAERPQDAVALRMRDELVAKATVVGLALLPRTARAGMPRWARRLILLAAVLCIAAAVGFAAAIIIGFLGAGS